MNQELFEKTQLQVAKELEIDEFSAPHELVKLQKKWHYWHSQYIAEKNILNTITEDLDKIMSDIVYGIKIGRAPITANNRAELDAIINQNKEYILKKKEKNMISIQVEYLKGIVKIFEQRIWVVKTLLEYEQKRG